MLPFQPGTILTAEDLNEAFASKAEAEHTHGKASVGLGAVDNTADADKPVSTAQAVAIQTVADAAAAAQGDIDQLQNDLASADQAKGAALSFYSGRNVKLKLDDDRTVKDYGADGTGDESAAAIAMLSELNRLVVPAGFTLTAKNLPLQDNSEVIVRGSMKLPSGCTDFDRMFHAAGKSGVVIEAKELDGSAAGQVGNIGTHLIYLTDCISPRVDVKYVHDHYISSGSPEPSVDGIRDTSTGAVFLYQCDSADVRVGLLEGWGREGVQLRNCTGSHAWLGHAQGTGMTEYSGLQVSGENNTVTHASVDNAGASAVGFDTVRGSLSNVLATNTRANHGVNCGHPGFPATESVLDNIVVDKAYVDGICVAASSQDVTIGNFSVSNAGRFGINASDGVLRARLTNGMVSRSGQANFNAFGSEIRAANVKSDVLDNQCLYVGSAIGLFSDGETVTSATGSATIRAAVKNLNGSSQILFLTGVTGSFSPTQTVTGSTSGATGNVANVYTPQQYIESSGGVVAEDVRYLTGAGGNQIRFPDGTAIMTFTLSAAATANSLGTFTLNYSSNVKWVSAPIVTATISSANATDGFVLSTLRAASTTTALTIRLKADQTQTYGISIIAVGRWK